MESPQTIDDIENAFPLSPGEVEEYFATFHEYMQEKVTPTFRRWDREYGADGSALRNLRIKCSI